MRKKKLSVLPLLLVLLLSLCLGAYPVSAASLKKPSGLKSPENCRQGSKAYLEESFRS